MDIFSAILVGISVLCSRNKARIAALSVKGKFLASMITVSRHEEEEEEEEQEESLI